MPREADQPRPGVDHHHHTERSDERGRGRELLLDPRQQLLRGFRGLRVQRDDLHARTRARLAPAASNHALDRRVESTRRPHHVRRAVPEFEQWREAERATGPAGEVGDPAAPHEMIEVRYRRDQSHPPDRLARHRFDLVERAAPCRAIGRREHDECLRTRRGAGIDDPDVGTDRPRRR